MGFSRAVVGVVAVSAIAMWPARAFADEVVVHEGETTYAGPDRAMLWSGIIAAGVPYAIGTVVAFQSNHPGDDKLYIPVAGPWIDLGERGGCPVAWSSCTPESVNKALLIGDGILQAVGTLSFISAFLHPEREVVESRRHRFAQKAELHLAPMASPGGSGLAVFGTF
jgi:hypothetical protein